jgi:hypothetical protein
MAMLSKKLKVAYIYSGGVTKGLRRLSQPISEGGSCVRIANSRRKL